MACGMIVSHYSFCFVQGEGDATYEIQVEGDECEDVATADTDVAKDNGVAASTGV